MAYLYNVYAVVQIAPTGIPTYVRLSQNENGRVLNFAVSGDALPAGSTVALSGTKPDGAVYSASGTLADNVATFNEDEQLTAVAGEWDAKVEVTNSGNLIATGRIKFVIDADPSGGNIPSDSQLDGYIAEMLSLLDAGKAEAYGSPLVASTVAGMIDQSRVYVYTGSETGYTAGNWYYWNGSAWTSGGVYNAVAVSTDTTLSIAGKAADAKATGDAIDALKDDLEEFKSDVFESSSGYPHKTVTELFTDGSYPLGVVYDPVNDGYTNKIRIFDIDSFNSYYVEVSEEMDLFFDSSLDIGRFFIGKISSVTNTERTSTSLVFTGTNPSRTRFDSEDFPTESNKFHVDANDTIIISLDISIDPNDVTVYYGESHTLSNTLNENIQLNDTQIQQVIESLPDPGEFPYSAKRALLDCLSYLGWATDEGRDYYDTLVEALNVDGHLDSITATFNQNGAAIYSTDSLDSLKPFLTVTANYADGSTAPVSDYTLTGTLTVGNCTITVGYEGKTTTFVVKCIAYFDHVTIDGVSYDISLSGYSRYKFIIKLGNNLLYLYYSDFPFYLRGAFPQSPTQDSVYITNIYGDTYRGAQTDTSFESQGVVGMTAVDTWGVINNYDDSNIGDLGREASNRTLSQLKWSLNDICLYDNGYTDTVVYPATQ